MSTRLFLFFKFLIESFSLCVLFLYTVGEDFGKALRKTSKYFYIFIISSCLQNILYAKAAFLGFGIIYVGWNLLLLTVFWVIAIKKRPYFSVIYGLFITMGFQHLQLLITILIYNLPSFADNLGEFNWKDNLFSTFLIWCFGIVFAFLTSRNIPKKIDLEKKETIWGVVFIVGFYLAEIILRKNLSEEQLSIPILLVLILLFFDINVFFKVFMISVNERIAHTEQAQLNQQLSLQQKHFEEVDVLYRKYRAIRHEEKNQAYYVQQMLKEKNYEQLEEYYDEKFSDSHGTEDYFDSGNYLINAIIWAKESLANQAGIDFRKDIRVGNDIPVKGYHLCSVIGNLLDNAIEACREVENPFIRIQIMMKQGYLYISVENSTSVWESHENQEFQTTKSDRLDHGYGIKNIRAIAELYDGMTSFSVQQGVFRAAVMLNTVL